MQLDTKLTHQTGQVDRGDDAVIANQHMERDGLEQRDERWKLLIRLIRRCPISPANSGPNLFLFRGLDQLGEPTSRLYCALVDRQHLRFQ